MQTKFIYPKNSIYDLFSPGTIDIIKSSNYNLSYADINSTNRINDDFKKNLVNDFQTNFVSTLKNQELEIDYENHIEILLENYLKKNEDATKIWLNDVYIENYNDTKFLINFLKIIGNFDKKLLDSFAVVIAGAALSNANTEVKEMAVRVFENLNSRKSYTFLKNSELSPTWLNDYKNKVVLNLEQELSCLI